MPEKFILPRYSDWHGHARQEDILEAVFGPSFGECFWLLLMPNIGERGLRAVVEVMNYYNFANTHAETLDRQPKIWPTFKVGPWTSPMLVGEMAGMFRYLSGKLYPDGVTTNSEGGVTDFKALYPTYEAMQLHRLPLNVHGEMPGKEIDDVDREARFLDTLVDIADEFPELKIVLEHISTAEAVDCVKSLGDNVAATITAHHPLLTHEDAMESGHNFCKPVAKTEADRVAVYKAMLSGDPKFFFGSDSAPHLPVDKQGADPQKWKAGVYSGPVALPLLVDMFSTSTRSDWKERLTAFACYNGCDFYGVERPAADDTVTLINEPWTVPAEVNGYVPFMAEQQLEWHYETAA